MLILLFDPLPALEDALGALGHDVRRLRLRPGVWHLPSLLQRMERAPDLLLQQENLGERVFLSGLEECPCPTLFWAIDSHLNMYWQKWYSLLFDAVLTPHLSLFAALPGALRPRRALRFAQPGQARAWTDHARRTWDLAMWARLTSHRPVRQWLTELLAPLGLHVTDRLSVGEMMRLYDATRVVPNECIANEVNFRLMEGASSGCLVLSPDVGEDQDALLRPGEEFLVWHDGLELLEQALWAKRHPGAAEAMGRAAMRRIQAEHLPDHRAAFAADLALSLPRNRLTGKAASLAFWLVMAMRVRAGALDIPPHEHARLGLRMAYSPPLWQDLPLSLRPLVAQTITQSLCLFAEKAAAPGAAGESGPALLDGGGVPWPVDEAYALCRSLLADAEKAAGQDAAAPPAGEEGRYARPTPAHTLELAQAASVFALRQGQFPMARAFWALHAGNNGKAPPPDPLSLCFSWADAWQRLGNIFPSGFSYVTEAGSLPESALSCLLFARTLYPEARERVSERCAALLRGQRGFAAMRLGWLAEQCLSRPDDWRTQLEYALACIASLRVEAGLFEAREARDKARRAGASRFFEKGLAASPGGRRLREALRAEDGGAGAMA
jgi:hypothetical protein